MESPIYESTALEGPVAAAARKKLTRQGVSLALGLFAVFVAGIGVLRAWNQRQERHALDVQAETSALAAAELAHLRLVARLSSAMDDARFLSHMPTLLDAVEDPEKLPAARASFLAFAGSKLDHQQLRYLDLSGREVIRIEREHRKPPRVVPQAELQDRPARPYEDLARRIEPDRVYVFPLDLNREHGQVERPLRPTIQLMTPVSDRQGVRRGTVALNYAGQELLDALSEVGSHSIAMIWLLDDRGNWLLAPADEQAWGGVLEERAEHAFASRYAASWQVVRRAAAGRTHALRTEGHILQQRPVTLGDLADRDEGRVAYLSGSPDEIRWHVVAAVPHSWVEGEMQEVNQRLDPLYLLAILVGAVATIWLTHALIQRAQDRRAIADRERLFRGLMSAAPDGFLVVRANGDIAMANPAAAQQFGYSVDGLRATHIDALVPAAWRGVHATYRKSFSAENEPRRMGSGRIVHAVRRDGSPFACSIMLSTVTFAGERLVLCAIRDVTFEERTLEMQRLNTALAQANVALETSMGELDAFNHSVAHDLRAPLRAISGFSAAIAEDYADGLPEEALHFLTRIRAGANRMGDMIDGLLSLPRVSRGTIERTEVDLEPIVEEAVRLLRAVEPDREVELSVKGDLRARADHRLVSLVIENLIGNAWKFTRNAARPRIEVGRAETERGPAFYVRDNGVGFDDRYEGKLFAAFQRLHTDADFEGTGIGLATVKGIIDKHGGSVWARSQPGQGATFFFTLGPPGSE